MSGENVHTQRAFNLKWTMSYYVAYIFLHTKISVIKWENVGGCQAPIKLIRNLSVEENRKMFHDNKH